MGWFSRVFGPPPPKEVDVRKALVKVSLDDGTVRELEMAGGARRETLAGDASTSTYAVAVDAKQVFAWWLAKLATAGFFEVDDGRFVPLSKIQSISVTYVSFVQDVNCVLRQG